MLNKIKRKFHGWVYPKEEEVAHFSPHYQHSYDNRHSSLVGSVVGLRLGAHVFSKPLQNRRLYLERFVYVGCIHGGNEEIFRRLEALVNDPPDYLVFTGDLTGSAEIEKLKKHFYDEKEGSPKGRFAAYTYFGNFAATLPKEKREELLAGLSVAAKHLLKVIEKIKKAGTKIYIIEGNWDNPLVSGIKAIAGTDIKDVFDTRSFFAENEYHFINNLKVLKTKTTLHIFLPYITLLHFDHVSKYKIREVEHEIIEAQYQNKTIVLVGHAEANWMVHHLSHLHPPTGKGLPRKSEGFYGERREVIRNFGRVMAIFKPHEVIYPHQHGRIRDEKEYLLSLEAKYLLGIVHPHRKKLDGYVRLVTNPTHLTDNTDKIIATYIPFGYLGEEEFIVK
jgi:Icc-related predicted phosphoesterase